MRSRKPIIMRSTPSFRRFPNVAFETVPMFVWLTMALSLVLSRKIIECFLFPCQISLPGDRWCDVLGFVPTGSVSSFSQSASTNQKTKQASYHTATSWTWPGTTKTHLLIKTTLKTKQKGASQQINRRQSWYYSEGRFSTTCYSFPKKRWTVRTYHIQDGLHKGFSQWVAGETAVQARVINLSRHNSAMNACNAHLNQSIK